MTHDDLLLCLREHRQNADRIGLEAERQRDFGAAIEAVRAMREIDEKIYVVAGHKATGEAAERLLRSVKDAAVASVQAEPSSRKEDVS